MDTAQREMYIRKLKRTMKRFSLLNPTFPLIPFSLGTLSYFSVRYLLSNRLLMTRSYLMDTLFFSFSSNSLRQILITESGTDTLFPLLLTCYWVTVLSTLTVMLWFPLNIILPRRFYLHDYQKALVSTSELRNAVFNFIDNPTFIHRWRLRRNILKYNVYSWMSPIQSQWFKYPEYHWFKSTALDKDVHAILNVLSKFKHALIVAVQYKEDLRQFLPSLELLEEFFFSIAQRSDKKLRGNTPTTSNKLEVETQIIKKLSYIARPIIIKTLRVRRTTKKRFAIISWVEQIISSQLVRNAATLSGLAGFVMFLGVVIFKVEPSPAFLTWFTVTFGSLTISIGVTSIQVSKNQKLNDSNKMD